MGRDIYGLYDDADDDYWDDDVDDGPPQSRPENSFSHTPPQAPSPPAVLREPPTEIGVVLPPVVVVPAHPRPDGQGVEIELSSQVTGNPVAVVFSTVERLIERLGRYQPWIMTPSAGLPTLLATAEITVVLDPLEKVCVRRWSADRLTALEVFQS